LLLIFGERKSDYYLSLPSHFLHELHLRVEFALYHMNKIMLFT
jgi:hypothetical protein